MNKVVAQVNNPVFLYISQCCNVPANKPACVKPLAPKGKKLAELEADATLGSWRCSACGQRCKCNRERVLDS